MKGEGWGARGEGGGMERWGWREMEVKREERDRAKRGGVG